jgi:hypothetical protein
MKITTHRFIRALRGPFVVLAASVLAPCLHSQILVSSTNGFVTRGTVGEYNLNGTPINSRLLTGLYAPGPIATDGTDFFVADRYQGIIGEYSMSGATINSTLVSGLGFTGALALSGTDLFVADVGDGTNGTGSIGEYTTSGTVVNSHLITGLSNPLEIAVSGSRIFVANDGIGTVSEYTTSGTLVNAALISGLVNPDGMAVSGSDIFVNQSPTQTTGVISEYTTSGVLVNPTLSEVSGFGAEDMAISGSTILVVINGDGTFGAGAIGAYDTSGSTINTSYISGLYEPTAVTAFPGPSGASVPDGGSTITLIGGALAGIAAFRRRFAK